MSNQSHKTQIEKYGGEEGFKAEMRRRRQKVKHYYLQDNPKAAIRMSQKRWGKSKRIRRPRTDDSQNTTEQESQREPS